VDSVVGLFKWFDRNFWALPAAAFVFSEAALIVWELLDRNPILLSSAKPEVRQQVYSSLSSTSSSLLGFSIASVAILTAFSPRQSARSSDGTEPTEAQVSEARGRVSVALLSASVFLLLLLVVTSYALSQDAEDNGSRLITFTVMGASLASLVGLVAGGFGLYFAVLERTRNP
jgi:hypothetical protein